LEELDSLKARNTELFQQITSMDNLRVTIDTLEDEDNFVTNELVVTKQSIEEREAMFQGKLSDMLESAMQ
jgi:hypothetical protein